MQVITDLQIHSKYSRAVSPQMIIPFIWKWAKRKGISLMATGDWTHPLWMREIKANLEEAGNGLLKLKKNSLESLNSVEGKWEENKTGGSSFDPYFLLATEVSSIYSQGGKGRRIHTLIWVPSLDSADKINKKLTERGCNLLSDGRPIIGLSSIEVADIVLDIDPTSLIIPAHCLLPDSCLITKDNQQRAIKDFKKGDTVLTHKGRYQKVEEILSRNYKGAVFKIKPWYFRPGLTVTSEHPFLAMKTLKKCPSTGDICRPSASHLKLCKRKTCLNYKQEWIRASQLEIGDVLVYPRQREIVGQKYLQISQVLPGFKKEKDLLLNGGTNGSKVHDKIKISEDLGCLIGYYLAEGYTDNRDSISFSFHREEKKYIDDVKELMKQVFGLDKCREYQRKNSQSTELTFYSKILSKWFAKICYFDHKIKKAYTKQIPNYFLFTKYKIQAEILRSWYRGDKGYTSSRVLMNQLKMLCLRLGIIPSIMVDSSLSHQRRGNHEFKGRKISTRHDNFYFSNWSFFNDRFNIKKEIPRSQTKLTRRHGWIDETYVYLPIKDIEKTDYNGKVYNLEVENDHSYIAEFACVHNCWTPWFSLYGSESGFDSIRECFGDFSKYIYAIETGLSSNPAMNWRIKDLDNRSIVSFSDSHSGPKLGREATVFELEEISYKAIRRAIMRPFYQSIGSLDKITPNKIEYTVEFYPEEGKYHYTGHRNCLVKQTPEETVKNGMICPVCGKKLTIGVMHRVEQLAGRTEDELRIKRKELKGTELKAISSEIFPDKPPFVMLVPLQEIIAEAIGSNMATQNVQNEYNKLTDAFDGEFNVLLKTKLPEIGKITSPKITEAIGKVRTGDITVDPGYDGVFGEVKIWDEEKKKEKEEKKDQLSLF